MSSLSVPFVVLSTIFSIGAFTVTLQLILKLPTAPHTSTVPGAIAVTNPSESTFATDVSLLYQNTDLSSVVFTGSNAAANVNVSPTFSSFSV